MDPTAFVIGQINQHFKDASDRLWEHAAHKNKPGLFNAPIFPNPHVLARIRQCECGAELGPDEDEFCGDCV